ncbi:MAG TPA: CHAD domain-containing protein, partial [Syntrophobacteria bacterium]|nr:CHAD domain-containing protein [Syntrophobacteria bacterium]
MKIGSDTPLWLAARALLAMRQKEFFRRWQQVQEGFELEPIHDMRIASRRLREGLALFAPCYPAKAISRITRRVKGVTRLLGDMRNTDEALLYFTSRAGRFDAPTAAALATRVAGLRKVRDQEEQRLRSALGSLSVKVLRYYFQKTLNTPLLFSAPSGSADPFGTIGTYARETIGERLALV